MLIMNNNIIIRRYFGSINEDSKEEKEFYLYYMASSDNYEFATKVHAYITRYMRISFLFMAIRSSNPEAIICPLSEIFGILYILPVRY